MSVWSPVSASTFSMPRIAALSRSLCSARRFRSRQTIWKTGSMPRSTSLALTASEPTRITAVWMSVTLTATTFVLHQVRAVHAVGDVGALGRADLAGDRELAGLEGFLELAHAFASFFAALAPFFFFFSFFFGGPGGGVLLLGLERPEHRPAAVVRDVLQGVVARLGRALKLGELSQRLEALVDQVPAAVLVLADLALPVVRAAAGAVDEALRAHGDRADAAGVRQEAVAALAAAFLAGPQPLQAADVDGVEAGDDAAQEHVPDGLDAHAAGIDDDGVGGLGLLDVPAEAHAHLRLVAHHVNHDLAGDVLLRLGQRGGGFLELLRPAGLHPDRAAAAPDQQDVLRRPAGGDDLGQFLLGRGIHSVPPRRRLLRTTSLVERAGFRGFQFRAHGRDDRRKALPQHGR